MRVLIVEDDTDSGDVLARFLERYRYDVGLASSANEAMRQLVNSTPDVMVVDLFMPEMDGVTLLEIARSYTRWHDVPAVIWTALPKDSPLVDRAREQENTTVVFKSGSTLDDVRKAIENSFPPPPASPPMANSPQIH